MNKKDSKQKAIETIKLFQQNDNLLFFKYQNTNFKRSDLEQFTIGFFRLFRESRIYYGELTKKAHLNPSLNWNPETMEVMLKNLNYFVIEEETIDFTEHLFLSVYIKIKGREINFLKIRLCEQFGTNVQNELWNQFQKYNTYKTTYFEESEKNVTKMKQQIQTSINRLQLIQVEEQQKAQLVKGKLSVLLTQKENKLLQLSGNKHKFVYKLQQQQLNDDRHYQSGVMNWMSSQDDRILVGSLFAPSQDYLI